jgi:hypothetical protein
MRSSSGSTSSVSNDAGVSACIARSAFIQASSSAAGSVGVCLPPTPAIRCTSMPATTPGVDASSTRVGSCSDCTK